LVKTQAASVYDKRFNGIKGAPGWVLKDEDPSGLVRLGQIWLG